MNDNQIGLMIGTIMTSIITIPTLYISGRKSYKMGVKDGAEINQKFNNLFNEVKEMIKNKE